MTQDKDEELEIVQDIVEGWKDNWSGIESYYNMLLYLSFIFVGIGIGTILVINRTLVAMESYPDFVIQAMATNVRQILIVSIVGFLACHAAAWLLSTKFA